MKLTAVVVRRYVQCRRMWQRERGRPGLLSTHNVQNSFEMPEDLRHFSLAGSG